MKTLTDWKLHSWYRTRDGRKAWLAAIAVGPDGEPVGNWPLTFCCGSQIWTVRLNGYFDDPSSDDKGDIIGPWTDEPRPLGRHDPVKHPPTEADGEHVLVGWHLKLPFVEQTDRVLKNPTDYKWWCPLKLILEMEVQK